MPNRSARQMHPSDFVDRNLGELQGSAGSAAFNAGANNSKILNAAPIGPARQVALISAPFTAKVSGKVSITATIAVTTTAVDDHLTFELVRDGTALAADGTIVGPTMDASAGHVTPVATTGLTWIDTVPVDGLTHTWGVRASVITGADQATIQTDGAAIVLEELPG